MKKRTVIKLSGQVFSMDQTKVLKDYATFFVKKSKTHQPVIVAGGGKIARYFISHARSSGADESTLDELGIEISRLNAKLLIYALKGKAYPHPPTTLTRSKKCSGQRSHRCCWRATSRSKYKWHCRTNCRKSQGSLSF